MRKGGGNCGDHKMAAGGGFFNKLAVPGALLGLRLTMKKKHKKNKKTKKVKKVKKTKSKK